MDAVQALFRDKSKTELRIVGIPTYLSVAESGGWPQCSGGGRLGRYVVEPDLDFGRREEEDKIKAFVKSRMREQEQALARLKGTTRPLAGDQGGPASTWRSVCPLWNISSCGIEIEAGVHNQQQ